MISVDYNLGTPGPDLACTAVMMESQVPEKKN
jgi:hypothetical protein